MKIRVSKRTEKGLRNGNESSIRLVTREFHKKVNGIMVSGGICRAGLGEIIFHSGNVNTFSYNQILVFYKKDLEKIANSFLPTRRRECSFFKRLSLRNSKTLWN